MKKLIILIILSLVSMSSVFADPELSILGITIGMTKEEVEEIADFMPVEESDTAFKLDPASFAKKNQNYNFNFGIKHDEYVDSMTVLIDNFCPIWISFNDNKVKTVFGSYIMGYNDLPAVAGVFQGFAFATSNTFGLPEIINDNGVIRFSWRAENNCLDIWMINSEEDDATILFLVLY